MTRRAALLLGWAPLCASPAVPPGFPPRTDPPKRLPDGRLLTEAIIKQDYERNLRELEEMERLLEHIEETLRKSAAGKAGGGPLRELEQVERLSKRIHARMRRY